MDPVTPGVDAPPSDGMVALEERLRSLEPISLNNLGDASLTDRFDTKFLVPAADLLALVDHVGASYRVLEVDDCRAFRYLTRYFDTPELTFYRAHVTRHYPRHKVRLRSYRDSSLEVLELKRKTNTGRTVKLRRALVGPELPLATLLNRSPFAGELPVAVDRLSEVVASHYRRITLVRDGAAERVTLDFDLAMSRGDRHHSYPGVAIVEIKQAHRQRSPVRDTLRAWHRRPLSVSKYVLGMVSCHPLARRQGARPLLRALARATTTPPGATRRLLSDHSWTTAISDSDC